MFVWRKDFHSFFTCAGDRFGIHQTKPAKRRHGHIVSVSMLAHRSWHLAGSGAAPHRAVEMVVMLSYLRVLNFLSLSGV